jgi:hypothetical protein
MVHVTNAALRGDSWFWKGYSGGGNVQHLIDSCRGRFAIVVGSGGKFEDILADVQRATLIGLRGFAPNPLIFAVNDIGMYLPHVDHWVSLHTPKLDYWVEIRRDATSKAIGNLDFQVHDGGLYGPRDWHQWTGLTPIMALSGLFAAQVAYLMGCEPIVLAGCPMDKTPRFFELSTDNPGYESTQEQVKAESAYKPDFKAAVRSMSGWSRGWFGAP